MKTKIISQYRKLSLIKKLLIPILLSLISGFILTIIIIKHVNEINHNTALLKEALIPNLERATNNKALLKKISENFTFAILAAEEDMVSDIQDNQIIESNLYEIMLTKEISPLKMENYSREFISYFKMASRYTLNSINHNEANSDTKAKKLLIQYNTTDKYFTELQEHINQQISFTIRSIDETANQLMYFTIIYILTFSLGLFYISYLIYKEFNRRFELLNKDLNVLGIQKTLFEQKHDLLDTLSQTINTTVTNYEIINKQRKELRTINQNIQNSIEYAALIQEAILPSKEILDQYTKDNFLFLKQKDTVGGDIYLIVELESKKEIIIMLIDGVGHGVSGAFLTILVKTLEHQLVEQINNHILSPSPAKILQYFNQNIKTILQQEKNSKSNVGFDGAVLYYNKQTNTCKYAGAKIPLYIMNDNKLNIIKPDRKSVGFIRTKMDQEYTEHDIKIEKDTKLYLFTDGIIDQEGEENRRYGKERFEKLLLENNKMPFSTQLERLQYSLLGFQKDKEQSDDITIMGLKF